MNGYIRLYPSRPRCACLKGMKIRCLEASGGDNYILLENPVEGRREEGEGGSRGQRQGGTNKDNTTEKQEEITFFNDDGTFVTVVVERNLRVVDLCNILAVKNRYSKDQYWTVIEWWPEGSFEKVIEDHEDILAVFRRTKSQQKQFQFRRILNKYDFFSNPAYFFPRDMSAFMKASCSSVDLREHLQNLIWNSEETPVIFSQANYLTPSNRTTWTKKFFVLKGTRLLMSADVAMVKKFLRTFRNNFIKGYENLKPDVPDNKDEVDNKQENDHSEVTTGSLLRLESGRPGSAASGSSGEWKDTFLSGLLPSSSESPSPSPDHLKKDNECGEKQKEDRRLETSGSIDMELELFADLNHYEIYNCTEAAETLGVPAAVCLRKSAEEDFASCLFFGTANKQEVQCWLAAMRLAKYGKQLRENYKSFKGKQESVTNQKDYQSDTMRSRVAMDFTGSVGRIVEDPKEAKEIERSEGAFWKKRWKEMAAHQQLRRGPGAQRTDEQDGAHVGQPWFHENLSRDQSVVLVNSLQDRDGVFLVRDSRSKPGCFVLTSKHNGKVLHTTIEPFQSREDGVTGTVYSIDGGVTKFMDIHQLVWFLILNPSTLPTKLVHWSKH